ncbi:MAG: PhoU domain-containing protein [Pseudomonadota bacterium]
MVLKELLSFWHDEGPLKEIIQDFDEMLMISKDMFERATISLTGQAVAENLRDDLVKMDKKLNALQQSIRRDIVTHIALQGTSDIIPCMLLISLIKDVERIGDYCKNFEEVARYSTTLSKDPLLPDLVDMRSKILIWFEQTKRAFDRKDKELARATREESYLHEKACDRLVWDLVKLNDGRNKVSVALALRYFKRIVAHLGNVCTSVIMPFDKLDYYEASLLQKK